MSTRSEVGHPVAVKDSGVPSPRIANFRSQRTPHVTTVVNLRTATENQEYVALLHRFAWQILVVLDCCANPSNSFAVKENAILGLQTALTISDEFNGDLIDTLGKYCDIFIKLTWDVTIRRLMRDREAKLKIAVQFVRDQMKAALELYNNPSGKSDPEIMISVYKLILEGFMNILYLNIQLLELHDQHNLNDIIRSLETATLSIRNLQESFSNNKNTIEPSTLKQLDMVFSLLQPKITRRIQQLADRDKQLVQHNLTELQLRKQELLNCKYIADDIHRNLEMMIHCCVNVREILEQPEEDFDVCLQLRSDELEDGIAFDYSNIEQCLEHLVHATEASSTPQIIGAMTFMQKEIQAFLERSSNVCSLSRQKLECVVDCYQHLGVAATQILTAINSPTAPNTVLTSLTVYKLNKSRLEEAVSHIKHEIKRDPRFIHIKDIRSKYTKAIAGLYGSFAIKTK